jgi:hypothetical protein
MHEDEHGRLADSIPPRTEQAEGPVLSKGETMPEPAKRPRFEVGTRILAAAPTNPHRGKQGVIVQIVQVPGDKIYRYLVRFDDGTTDALFGFELQLP